MKIKSKLAPTKLLGFSLAIFVAPLILAISRQNNFLPTKVLAYVKPVVVITKPSTDKVLSRPKTNLRPLSFITPSKPMKVDLYSGIKKFFAGLFGKNR